MTIVGRKGGAFNITGTDFGEKGQVFIEGRQITTTAWTDVRIKGQLPGDITSGKVVVKTLDAADKVVKEQTTVFPTVFTSPPAPVPVPVSAVAAK